MQKQTVRTDNELVKNTRTALTRHVWIIAWLSFNCRHKERPTVQIIRFRCCLLVTFDRLLSLTISTMCQINVCRRKYDAEKGCGAKFGRLWEFALGYSAHLLDCGHLFSEGVYTDQSPICIGLLHATWICFPKQIWLLAHANAHDLDTRNNG